ncbi:hypothetical protein M8J76_008305 [Diaphorina citri]|nr:hypothetical protein M8J76_008305 [Diaphorina citri]
MLDYEKEMLLNLLHQDGLLIGAKGLNTQQDILLNLIRIHCEPGNLVLILSAEPEEEGWLLSQLTLEGVTPLPRVLSCENNASEREKIYLQGGVLFVPARILVVDMLKKKVPIEHITGFIVLRAHRILESCQEAFALRLYRQNNKTGFIKAISSSPQSFLTGFAQLEKILRSLFLRHVYLMPRFQATVKETLEKRKPDVIELRINLTSCMSACQNAVLDIGSYLLKELKRLNVGLLDMDEISIESIYSSQFHRSLQVKLDPVWHQLSKVSKQIIADLRTLRHLLLLLLDSDAIHLASVLASLRSPDYVHKSSGWPLLDQAETLILNVEERRSKREQQPKWSVLKEILSEIHDSSGKEGGGQEMALVLVNDVSTCRQLRKLLTDGADKIFNDTTRYISRTRPESLAQLGKPPSTESPTDDPDTHDDPVDKDSQDSEEEESFMLSQKPNERELCLTADRVAEPTDLSSKLRSLKPTSVIFYNADVAAIRQVEVYQCAQSEVKVKVFFMQYGESVEEQAYLSDLRREKKAFEYLIQEKTNMAVPTEQDGVSTEPEESCGRVIVDMREFRSELPVLLHKRGLYIEPVTISVGDYILSPDICVERKSISDLIGSLQSGRLYTQVQQMCRHYAKPLLLIEFDHNKPFELQGNYYLSRDIAAKSSDITAKLQLLTLHFPKLRLIWSSGPYNTAQLFFELKQGRDEPSAEVASRVTSKNKAAVLNRGSSLPALCKLSEQELCSLVENTTLGNALYKALHTRPEVSSGSLVTRTKKHQRFRATKAAAKK